jgi:hypothetical protein
MQTGAQEERTMSISASIHSVTGAEARTAHDISWLVLKARNGQEIDAFMPYAQAKAMADAFNAASADGGEGE